MTQWNRHRLSVSDTGTTGDTGPSFVGRIYQMQWRPTTDTGGTIQVTLVPETDDTGSGFLILNDTGGAGEQLLYHPRGAGPHKGAATKGPADTGVVYYVGAGDKLRLRTVAKGTAAITGVLRVWFGE